MALPVDTTHIPSWQRWRWVVFGAAGLAAVLALGLAWKFLLPHSGPQQDPAIVEAIAQARASREAAIALEEQLRKNPNAAELRLEVARLLLDRGDPRGAAIEAQKALKAGMSPLQALPVRVHALIRSGDAKAAIAEMTALTDGADTRRLQGDLRLLQGDWAAAQAAYRAALALEAGNVAALLGLAEALERTGDVAGAKVQLAAALQAAPQSPEAQVALGTWQLVHASPTLARATLREAARVAGEAGKLQQAGAAWIGIADIDFAAGNVPAADVGAGVLMRLLPGTEAAELRRARADLLLGKPAAAEERLRRLLRKSPDNDQVQLYLGVASKALGKPEAARMYLAAAANSTRTEVPARRMLGRMLLAAGQADDAVRLVDENDSKADSDLLALGGRASLLTGDTDAALDYFRRSVAAAPNDVRRKLDLARAFLSAGQAQQALGVLDATKVAAAQEPERLVLRTAALVQAGQRDAAKAGMQALAASRPDDADAQWLAARGFVLTGDPVAARAAVLRVTQLSPQDAGGFTALGLLSLATRDLAGATRALDRALQLAPAKPEALYARANLAAVRDDAAGTEEWLVKTVAAAPKSLPPRIALVRLAMARGDLAGAQKRLKELRGVAPANMVAVDMLEAQWLEQKGDRTAALAAWQRLAEGNPQSAEIQAQLTATLVRAGKLVEAKARLKQAMAADGTDVAVLKAAGDLAMRNGDARAASEAYGRALAQAPTRDLAVRQFAALRAQRSPQAEQPLRDWLQRRPADITVRLALANSLEEAGNNPQAIAELERVLKDKPRHPGASNNLAWLKLQSGDAAGAIVLAKVAVDAAPRQFEFVDTYATALAKAGRTAEAKALLQQAQTVKPVDRRYGERLTALGLR
jgi:tetratricopeptide (TPR) repeat protein